MAGFDRMGEPGGTRPFELDHLTLHLKTKSETGLRIIIRRPVSLVWATVGSCSEREGQRYGGNQCRQALIAFVEITEREPIVAIFQLRAEGNVTHVPAAKTIVEPGYAKARTDKETE